MAEREVMIQQNTESVIKFLREAGKGLVEEYIALKKSTKKPPSYSDMVSLMALKGSKTAEGVGFDCAYLRRSEITQLIRQVGNFK